MSISEHHVKLSPMKDVIIHRVTSPFETPTYCYKIIFATKDGIETHTVYDLDAVYSAISEFYEGEKINVI